MDNLDHQSARITRNPHPVQRYELTFTLHDAPGPFDAVTASAAYEIANKECVPRQPVSGANPAPAPVIPIDVERVGDNTYRGYVYLDLLKDEDYYGLGVCHWQLVSAGPDLKINGSVFGDGLMLDDIEAGKVARGYFWKPYYFLPPKKGYAAGGVPESVYLQAREKSNYFYVAMSARKAEP